MSWSGHLKFCFLASVDGRGSKGVVGTYEPVGLVGPRTLTYPGLSPWANKPGSTIWWIATSGVPCRRREEGRMEVLHSLHRPGINESPTRSFWGRTFWCMFASRFLWDTMLCPAKMERRATANGRNVTSGVSVWLSPVCSSGAGRENRTLTSFRKAGFESSFCVVAEGCRGAHKFDQRPQNQGEEGQLNIAGRRDKLQ